VLYIINVIALNFDVSIVLCFMYTILKIPQTKPPSINSGFIFIYCIFRPYFWVTFRWYTRLNINHLNLLRYIA
jgi:hypothetical protein